RLAAQGDRLLVGTADGTQLLAKTVVNAAGLQACSLLQLTEGLPAAHAHRAWFAKGNYFSLSMRAPFEHLIYPAPEPDVYLAGLGVHLTLDLGGQAKFGPDVQWVERDDDWSVDISRQVAFEAAI